MYPVVRVVSVVCRRWRKAALSAVERLPRGLAVTPEALPLLPSLQHLRLTKELITSGVALPLSLRSLHVGRAGCNMAQVTALSCVTELDIDTSVETVVALLAHLASTLSTLRLKLPPPPKKRTADYVRLNRFYMPRLHTLSLLGERPHTDSTSLSDVDDPEPLAAAPGMDVLPLLKTHSSALTSLRLGGLGLRDLPPGVRFPALTHLDVSGAWTHAAIAQLSPALPALRDISLRNCDFGKGMFTASPRCGATATRSR